MFTKYVEVINKTLPSVMNNKCRVFENGNNFRKFITAVITKINKLLIIKCVTIFKYNIILILLHHTFNLC